MDGQCPPPITPLVAFRPGGYPPMLAPEASRPRLDQFQASSMESFGGYSDFGDSTRSEIPTPQGSQRSRRRQNQSSDHVKHRRTRSGCYTCRQRRVKCDEQHPICDRCRKGKRDCTYPGKASSSSSTTIKTARSYSKAEGSPEDWSSSGSDTEGVQLSAVPKDGEEDAWDEEPHSPASQARKLSDSSSSLSGQIKVPAAYAHQNSARPKPGSSHTQQLIKSDLVQSSQWASLPVDIKYYLTYQREHMSHHHYAFKYDGGNFLKTTFIELAINDKSVALLYAIVAFAAYHHTVAHNDDNIFVFLSYYNKSIAQLQQSLKNKRHNVVTLLTILQLATIEEFLGDWINLMGHQKAACRILTDLFTPQTMMRDETRRIIMNWYFRFELFAGMMAGEKTILDREWFAVAADFYRCQTRDRPNDLGARFEEYFATSRLLATDVTILFGAKNKDSIDDEEFSRRVRLLTAEFAAFGQTIETAFTDPACFVKTFARAPSSGDHDNLDFRDPHLLYAGELSTMNFVLLDHWAIDLMFRHQTTRATGEAPYPELSEIALKKCRLFEAIQYGEESGPAAVLGAQASLGISALFLPRDESHTMWCRRRFAIIERLGYVYPASFRTHMTEMWGEDVTTWWLPNEEGYSSTLRIIREFIEYRAPKASDAWATSVRDMSGVFHSLGIEGRDTLDSLNSARVGSRASP